MRKMMSRKQRGSSNLSIMILILVYGAAFAWCSFTSMTTGVNPEKMKMSAIISFFIIAVFLVVSIIVYFASPEDHI